MTRRALFGASGSPYHPSVCFDFTLHKERLKALAKARLAMPPRYPLFEGLGERFHPGDPVALFYFGNGIIDLAVEPWGFPGFGRQKRVANTRSETAAEKLLWRDHLENRCVMPVGEAIEWQWRVDERTGEVIKVPHAISLVSGEVGLIAAIRHEPTGYPSMMTCRANDWWGRIHNKDPDDPRMICYLQDDAEVAAWLDPERSFEDVKGLLRPAPEGAFTAKEMGKPPPDAPLFGA